MMVGEVGRGCHGNPSPTHFKVDKMFQFAFRCGKIDSGVETFLDKRPKD